MTDRELKVSDARVAIAELRDSVTDTWLRAAVPKQGQDEHPLAQWFRLGDVADDKEAAANEQFLYLGRLASAIMALRIATVTGIEAKVEHLTKTDGSQFLSAVHEVLTAEANLRQGNLVSFVPEASTKTPDILLDEQVEIECKRKTDDSKKHKGRHDTYELLDRKLQKVLSLQGAPNGLTVVAHFATEPTRLNIDAVADAALRFDYSQPATEFVTRDGQCRFSIEPVLAPTTNFTLPSTDPTQFDVVQSVGTKTPVAGGGMSMTKVLTTAYKSHNPQDRVQEIKKSLKDAARQLSGLRPAVIQLDATANAHAYTEAISADISKMIERFFRSNSRVSAIRLDLDAIVRDGQKVTLSRRTEEILNPDAALPLPPKYQLSVGAD